MNASELEYELPQELIAQHPPETRDESRLLVYSRATGEVRHGIFRDFPTSYTDILANPYKVGFDILSVRDRAGPAVSPG